MDAVALNKRNERIRLAQEQRQADLKWLLATPYGQRYFGAFLDETCGLLGGTYNAQASDPAINTVFEEGRRSVGIDLTLEMQAAAPKEFAAVITARVQLQNEEAARAREAVPKQGES